MLVASFHLWADGNWHEPVREYFEALDAAGFDGPLIVGIVGTLEQRTQAESAIPRPHHPVYADEGFEQVTLDAVRAYAIRHPDDAVMYGHTKGAHSDSGGLAGPWRRTMIRHVVARWRENLEALDQYDAVGCHWITPEQFPDATDTPYFGGNFWIARCTYIQTLPVCLRINELGEPSRGQAEVWIGRGAPQVLDLLPGWPCAELDRD